MRGRQTAKQAAPGDGESRGRRKLDFAVSSSSKTAQPLQGKVFFLDLRGYGALNIKKLETNIVLLGGSVVNFFDKDVGVTHVISNQDGAKKDAPPGAADSPAASTPSPFSAATSVRRSLRGNLQSPAVDSPSNPGSSSAVSRGKAIARKAMDTQKQGSSNVLSIAKQLKLKVKHIDVAAQWIEEQAAKLKKAGVKVPQKAPQPKENRSKVRKLKGPFVKFEDSSRQYRPVYEELPTFPRVNVDTPSGSCPFDGGTYQDLPVAERSKEEGEEATGKKSEQRKEESTQRKEESTQQKEESAPRKDESAQRKEDSTQRPDPQRRTLPRSASKKATTSQSRSKASALKAKKNAGYCECCMLKYNDLQQHIRGDQHRAFVKRQENYSSLDRRIRNGPVLDRFLKDVMKYHPIDKTRALQSPGWPEDPDDPNHTSDEVVLVSDPVPETVVQVPRWPTPAMRKMGMTAPSVISSISKMSAQKRQMDNAGSGSSFASSVRNLSDEDDNQEERDRRKHKKKMAKVTTPQKVFGSSPEKRFPALDRLVQSVESKLEKRKSSEQGSQCSSSKRARLEVFDDSPERRKAKETESAEKSRKNAQKSLNRLLEVEEGRGRPPGDQTPTRLEHPVQDPELNLEQNDTQDKVSRLLNKPSPASSILRRSPRMSPRERNVRTHEKAEEKVEHSGQELKRSAKKKKTSVHSEDNVSYHKEHASVRPCEVVVSKLPPSVTPEKRHSLLELQTTPIRASDELERRQRELVRSPSPVIGPETRQSLPKDNTTSVLSSTINTSTPFGHRTQQQRKETTATPKEKPLQARRSPRASTQPKIKPAQESTNRPPGRKALRKTKHLENSSDGSVHKQDLNTQVIHTDQCADLFLSSDPAEEFLGFDLTVSEADRIWQQASGVDLSRRALMEGSSDKSEIFEIDIGAFQSEGSDWDKPVTGFISAELSRKVSVNTMILSPRDSDKENQEGDFRRRLKSAESTSSDEKTFFTKDVSGNLLSDVRLRRLELERRISQGKLSQTRTFCEIAGLPPMPEPPPTPAEPPPPPEVEGNIPVTETSEAGEENNKCEDVKAPMDLLDHIDHHQAQPGPSRVATRGKKAKNTVEEVIGVEDVQSVGWSDCGKEDTPDFFRLKVRNPQTNELHIIKASKPIQLDDPFYIMSAPSGQVEHSGKKGHIETGAVSPGVSPKGKFKYKPSPKKVLNYKSRQVLPKSPVKNAYSRPPPEIPESAVRRIMDDLGFQQPSREENYKYIGTPHAHRRLSEVEVRDMEYEELIEQVINTPRWVSESLLGPLSSESMTSNIDALDLLDDWNTLISDETEGMDTQTSSDPTGSNDAAAGSQVQVESVDPATAEGENVSHEPAASEGQSEKHDRSEEGIWEKLEKWVSEGSSDKINADEERPSKKPEKPHNVVDRPVVAASTKKQQPQKLPSKSPRRSSKSQQQAQKLPSKSPSRSSKSQQQPQKLPSKSPTISSKSHQGKQEHVPTQAAANPRPTTHTSKKSSTTSSSKKKGIPPGIQLLAEKYRRRPPGPSHYKAAMGRYRKIMRLPIRRHQEPVRKPVRKRPTKKPTRRSPRVILHRLNLQTVETTPTGEIIVQPAQAATAETQTGQQNEQEAPKRKRRVKRKLGRPPKNPEGAQQSPIVKRKRGRPPKNPEGAQNSPSVKRKRGRPPKNTQGAQHSPSGMQPVRNSKPISTAYQPESVLNGLDVSSSPGAMSSPQQLSPRGRPVVTDSGDRWTSPRSKKKIALHQVPQQQASPGRSKGKGKGKKKYTSPTKRRGRPPKKRIPEGRNK